MKLDTPQLREMAPELLALLDEEIRMLHLRKAQFDELYDLILHHNEPRMEALLDEMTCAQQDQTQLDTKLKALRTLFAKAIGCQERELRLLLLAKYLDPPYGTELQYRREQIILLAEQLKRKHLDTAMLLSESARVNRILLEGLLPSSEPVTVYGTNGTKPWRSSSGLVDAEM